MKTIFKIFTVTAVILFQNYKSQDVQKYISQYENTVPKLQEIARGKNKFYGENFSLFIDELENKKVKIFNFGYDGKIANRPEIYVLRLWFNDIESIDIVHKNKYQFPIVLITFQEQIPNKLSELTIKHKGKLSQEVKDFLADRKIEKIEFYGINGLTNTDKSPR